MHTQVYTRSFVDTRTTLVLMYNVRSWKSDNSSAENLTMKHDYLDPILQKLVILKSTTTLTKFNSKKIQWNPWLLGTIVLGQISMKDWYKERCSIRLVEEKCYDECNCWGFGDLNFIYFSLPSYLEWTNTLAPWSIRH